MKDNMVQTMVIGLYIIPAIVTLIIWTLAEWFDNPKGRRVLTKRNAIKIALVSFIPAVNVIAALVCIVATIVHLAIDKTGLSHWWDNGANKALFKDSK